MRLSDIMSHAGLAIYAEVALVLFLIVFLTVVARVFAPGHDADHEAARRLPFEDGPPAPEDRT